MKLAFKNLQASNCLHLVFDIFSELSLETLRILKIESGSDVSFKKLLAQFELSDPRYAYKNAHWNFSHAANLETVDNAIQNFANNPDESTESNQFLEIGMDPKSKKIMKLPIHKILTATNFAQPAVIYRKLWAEAKMSGIITSVSHSKPGHEILDEALKIPVVYSRLGYSKIQMENVLQVDILAVLQQQSLLYPNLFNLETGVLRISPRFYVSYFSQFNGKMVGKFKCSISLEAVTADEIIPIKEISKIYRKNQLFKFAKSGYMCECCTSQASSSISHKRKRTRHRSNDGYSARDCSNINTFNDGFFYYHLDVNLIIPYLEILQAVKNLHTQNFNLKIGLQDVENCYNLNSKYAFIDFICQSYF